MAGLLATIAVAVISLNVSAICLDLVWPPRSSDNAFYSGELIYFDDLPYWLCANMLLLVINGFSIIGYARLTVKADNTTVSAGANTIYRVVGYNLITVPILLLLPRVGLLLD